MHVTSTLATAYFYPQAPQELTGSKSYFVVVLVTLPQISKIWEIRKVWEIRKIWELHFCMYFKNIHMHKCTGVLTLTINVIYIQHTHSERFTLDTFQAC